MPAPLLCIMGPTASGKTDLAVALAQDLNGELISVDSALVYRGLDIGSAKPQFPHHLVDICDPADAYSAARFVTDARRAIADVEGRGRRAILVGGTMLYYRALLFGLAAMPAANPQLREELNKWAAAEGWPALHRELQRVDPESAARIHPNHSQRLVRALEVYRITGRRLSELHRETPAFGTGAPVFALALAPQDRADLHARIASRFRQMMQAGFLEEVAALQARGDLHLQLPALRAVGYRQLWECLQGHYDLQEAEGRALAASRQLAKRQLTWLRKWPALHWLYTDARGRLVRSELPGDQPVASESPNPADWVLNYLRSNPI